MPKLQALAIITVTALLQAPLLWDEKPAGPSALSTDTLLVTGDDQRGHSVHAAEQDTVQAPPATQLRHSRVRERRIRSVVVPQAAPPKRRIYRVR